METLKELKAIIAGKPEGAISIFGDTYLDADNRFYADGCWFGSSGYIEIKQPTRSLSDIERIIELMEQVKSGYEAYTRIEAVKQRYNAENKSKTELLLEAEILLRSGTQEHCNILADNIMEALK